MRATAEIFHPIEEGTHLCYFAQLGDEFPANGAQYVMVVEGGEDELLLVEFPNGAVVTCWDVIGVDFKKIVPRAAVCEGL